MFTKRIWKSAWKFGLICLICFVYLFLQILMAPGPNVWGHPWHLLLKYGFLMVTTAAVLALFTLQPQPQRDWLDLYEMGLVSVTLIFCCCYLLQPYVIGHREPWFGPPQLAPTVNPVLRWIGSGLIFFTFSYLALTKRKFSRLLSLMIILLLCAGVISLMQHLPNPPDETGWRQPGKIAAAAGRITGHDGMRSFA